MSLGKQIASALKDATFERVAAVGLANAELNRPRIGRSVLELGQASLGRGDAALVVGAGPSLHRRRSLERLKASGFTGTIVAADGALGACLRAGVVPHIVVSVDPHPERIVRWFGDPALTEAGADDYFRRQEMDPAHHGDEVAANRALVELVDAHAPRIKVAVATSAAPAVVDRCEKAGMALYWWNPMYDDYDRPGSVSRRLFEMNGLPCLNGGGNVGTAAWVLAHAVLKKRRVGLIGMDLSYAPGTPYEKTQYYPELVELLGARHPEAFVHVTNPYLGETWFSDPAYYWFREVFLEMAAEAPCETYNCTEGGLLFGPGIATVRLEEFLGTGKDGHHG
ncbi:MAG TPA: 6-hydroxymethylpterin diphosphokinase MptE-like protein [Methylomirabilota bacterium]|nr:6-hydroxymethylpterin diphosphokinase MptE-like protein [Methylomirabilota bacterium]